MFREVGFMTGACLNLFDYVVRRVSVADVLEYAPNDPGYPKHVRVFTEIIECSKLPRDALETTETIDLTRWWRADREQDPTRFRRFRCLTNAVGMALGVTGELAEDVEPPNYLAISLIDDVCALNDAYLVTLLLPAFDEFHEVLKLRGSEESAFLLLACLLVEIQLGADAERQSQLAEQIISEESKRFDRQSPDFLWGSTNFDQLNKVWKGHLERLLAPSTPSLTLLRDALLAK